MSAIVIPIRTRYGETEIQLFASSNCYFRSEDADKYGEAVHQLYEGCEYEYRFANKRLQFADNTLVYPSSDTKYPHGYIRTGNYVGTLHLDIEDETGEVIGGIDFEIQSKKISYRDDYRRMLSDITSYYTELVMIAGSPVSQKFEPNNDDDNRTIYQKFAFVKSIVDNEDFEDAIHKILYNPVRKWTGTVIERPIVAVKRLGKNSLRQIVTRCNRMELPEEITIPGNIHSVPQTVTVPYKRETTDTPENRFIKFVLISFHQFCRNLQDLKCAKSNVRLLREANACCEKLEIWLDNAFFKDVRQAQFIALNSPVLQKREGYREVLQAWTMFDLAAKLSWKGGDNVYEAGKRNIAALYEYWLFFKLLEIISSKFDIPAKEKAKLVRYDKDHINLVLQQGRMIMVGGKYKHESRDLNIRFYYNRTFTHNTNHQNTGSWSTAMRPDYTLSIWPGNITANEAEIENTIVHIHFDAKYKVNQIQLLKKYDLDAVCADDDTLDDDVDDELLKEKEEQRYGVYKRGDLLKMHAYNDAIRRTGGSYVLYPGTQNNMLRGFHEIIPGLGAFAINPNSYEEDSIAIKNFLDEIIENFLNRISQREQKAYYDYKVYNTESEFIVRESLPEPLGMNRNLIPTDVNVLVAYYKNSNHLMWILNNRIYNVRTGTGNGSILLTQETMTAQYILLHSTGDTPQLLLKLKKQGAKIYSGSDLMKKAKKQTIDLYRPSNLNNFYLVFELDEIEPQEEFKEKKWCFSAMQHEGVLKRGPLVAEPKGISLATLMHYVVKD